MNHDIIDKIVRGEYDGEVIETAKKVGNDMLIREIVREVGDYDAANKILIRFLDSVGIPYTICSEKKKVITYLDVVRHITEYRRLDHEDGMSEVVEEEDYSEYFCPHCGRKIKVNSKRAAIEVLEGKRDEHGYLKNLGEYPVEFINTYNYKIDMERLKELIAWNSKTLYSRMLDRVKKTEGEDVKELSDFRILVFIESSDFAVISGKCSFGSKTFEYVLAHYKDGGIKFYDGEKYE
jgi:Zn finger protein HypA/HybF involved in hydrogenase expression